MDSHDIDEYNSLLREIGKLKEELKITNAKRVESLQSFSRIVEMVTTAPEPLLKGHFVNEGFSMSKRNSTPDFRKEKRKSMRWSKKIEPVISIPTMDSHIWGTVFSFLDYFSLCYVCTVCKRFNEIVHTTVQHVLDEQTCLHLWYKRLESIPKVSPWVPTANAIMPLYVFPSFGLSFRSKEKKTAEKNNKAIEAEIKKQRRKKSSVILVLGPPGAGKSSFVFNHIFTPPDLEIFKEQIREYTVTTMKEFLAINDNETLFHTKPEDVTLSTIPNIWKDQKLQNIYFEHLASENSSSNAHYFFENATNIAAPNYKPTREDLRHLKFNETSSMVELTKNCNELTFKIIIVQDFQMHPRFFHNVFSTVGIVYLCIPLVNFDTEHEDYIREVVNRRFFYSKCVVVLTKVDLFKNNLQEGKISDCIKTIIDGNTEISAALNKISEYVKHISSNTLRSIVFLNNLEDQTAVPVHY